MKLEMLREARFGGPADQLANREIRHAEEAGGDRNRRGLHPPMPVRGQIEAQQQQRDEDVGSDDTGQRQCHRVIGACAVPVTGMMFDRTLRVSRIRDFGRVLMSVTLPSDPIVKRTAVFSSPVWSRISRS